MFKFRCGVVKNDVLYIAATLLRYLFSFAQFSLHSLCSQSTIDILKIDVEYAEWAALEAILLEGSLVNVKQLIIEIHKEEVHGKTSNATDYAYYWQILRGVSRLGFKYWFQDPSPYTMFISKRTGIRRACSLNMHFINIKYLL